MFAGNYVFGSASGGPVSNMGTSDVGSSPIRPPDKNRINIGEEARDPPKLKSPNFANGGFPAEQEAGASTQSQPMEGVSSVQKDASEQSDPLPANQC